MCRSSPSFERAKPAHADTRDILLSATRSNALTYVASLTLLEIKVADYRDVTEFSEKNLGES